MCVAVGPMSVFGFKSWAQKRCLSVTDGSVDGHPIVGVLMMIMMTMTTVIVMMMMMIVIQIQIYQIDAANNLLKP